MEYKGYVALVEFDKDFQVSVDDYLEFCRERNEEPDKPFSGRILVRVDPELHREIYLSSRAEDKSLNTWIAERLDAAVARSERNQRKKEAG